MGLSSECGARVRRPMSRWIAAGYGVEPTVLQETPMSDIAKRRNRTPRRVREKRAYQ